ncbi:TPA: hypothetical protein KDX70_004803 [Vibrio parahaemolyticus]|nr:hypothetical protein [Vibrio parahaemolyticus]HCZ9712156.1 hypothetical protein [Vibrio parahaemolyticus]
MKLKSILFSLLVFSNNVFASDIIGEWNAQDVQNNYSYHINIKAQNDKVYMSYVFVSEQGRKINDESHSSILLSPISNTCWKGEVFDIFHEEKEEVTLCSDSANELTWNMKSAIPYVPKFEIFTR